MPKKSAKSIDTNLLKKPKGVPVEARWNKKENEWEIGEKNSKRKEVGMWKYWRTDGSLVGETFFDKNGKAEGVAKRYHPNGEISQWVRYRQGRVNGRQYWTRALSGQSSENLNFPAVAKMIYRFDTICTNGKMKMNCYTYYNKDGAKSPIEVDNQGNSKNLGKQLKKLWPTTALYMKADGLLQPIAGRPHKLKKGDLVYYMGLAGGPSKNPYQRIKFLDKRENLDEQGITVVDTKELEKKLTLAVDKIDFELASKA